MSKGQFITKVQFGTIQVAGIYLSLVIATSKDFSSKQVPALKGFKILICSKMYKLNNFQENEGSGEHRQTILCGLCRARCICNYKYPDLRGFTVKLPIPVITQVYLEYVDEFLESVLDKYCNIINLGLRVILYSHKIITWTHIISLQ